MSEIVQGLFGLTPDEVRQKQYQSADDGAMAFARLDPYQKASYMGGKAGAGMVQGIAPMLGGVNIEQQRAQQTQGMQQQIDHSSSDGLMKGAQLFRQTNPKLAMQYAQAAQAMKDKESARALQAAQTEKALREPDRTNEYERWAAVLNESTSTEDEKKQAIARMAVLDAKAKAAGGGNTNSTQLVRNADGTMSLVYKDGRPSALVKNSDGTPLRPAENSVQLALDKATASAGGKVTGEASAEAQVAIPEATTTLDTAIRHVNELLSHPAFSKSVGIGMPEIIAENLRGTDMADFVSRRKQLKGGAFLAAYKILKGGGPITDIEGNKATEALNRMTAATSEKAFSEAAADYIQALNDGLNNLKKKAGTSYKLPAAATPRSNVSSSDSFPVTGGKPLNVPLPASPSTLNDQALKWARSNPNDPRSAQILKKLGY